MDDRPEPVWQSWDDEPVEVNQRALIDKVLARYSGEFTLFREMLQNSDDAQSRTAEIRFETDTYLVRKPQQESGLDALRFPDLKTANVKQWTFRNDGKPFGEQDWKRLPKIAEGNPGREKIGAFGVGFYSLFSVTDEPFVSSAGRGMHFYWKDNKNQLFVHRGSLPESDIPDPWTTFVIPLRESGPMPPALDLLRFLASSITFMINLREIRVFFDEHCIGSIKKVQGLDEPIEIPEHLQRTSRSGYMNVKSVARRPIKIEAEYMHALCPPMSHKSLAIAEPRFKGGFFGPIQVIQQLEALIMPTIDPKSLHRTTVGLTVFTAEVTVELDEKLSRNLSRSTHKQPPSLLKYGLIYTGKDEYDQSLASQHEQFCRPDGVFQGLRADLNGATHTRVFIGHATGQTTGIGGHMASYFIPTVERESIDLVDRNILVWNENLLYVGGFLSRAVYELELTKIQDEWQKASEKDGPPPAKQKAALDQQYLHLLKFFTFHRSTPSEKVSRILKEAFFECSSAPLRLLSSAGVHAAPEIKECDLVFSKFLKYLPMLPQYVIQEGSQFTKALPEENKISRITFLDVLEDLGKHDLTPEELVSCLQWWTSRKDGTPYNTTQLWQAITLSSANNTTLALSSVEYYIGSESTKAHIPLDGPLPESLMPYDITKRFTPAELGSFGWREFTVNDWLQHISKQETMSKDPKFDLTQSVEWAEKVLGVLSGVWSSSSDTLHHSARTIFEGKQCIPTSRGLYTPHDSFLSNTANTTLFEALGLPIVRFSAGLETKTDMEVFLSAMGVRRHVPPQLLLDRMVDTGNWSISDLIGYLVQIQNSLDSDEFSKLKDFKGFTKEGAQEIVAERPRYRASELYPPLAIFQELQLPVIDWGDKSKWQDESEQAELLYRLGLRRLPPLEKIVELCSIADVTVREKGFRYLCENLRSKYSHYKPDNFREIPFIPAVNENGFHLAKLGEVFWGASWKALGFSVAQDSTSDRKFHIKELGVQYHPPTSKLLELLETTPPTTEDMARQWFESLFECIPSFSKEELLKLSTLPIVPTKSSGDPRPLAPTKCYLGEGTNEDFHTKLFVFVDFGPKANQFLRACGSKNEPSVKDIAESLVEDPERFLELAGGYEAFLGELCDLASRSRRIPNDTLNKMMKAPILLGIRRKRTKEGGEECERVLRKPGEIVIADDINSHQLFGDMLFVAPQEQALDGFYASLGSPRLSAIVEEKYQESNETLDTETSSEIQSLVLQRLPLFLRENSHTQIQSQLPTADNFKVRICERLMVTKTLTVAGKLMIRTEPAWAAVTYNEDRQVDLWISCPDKAEPDMYEIARSLCRQLFKTAKVSDTLLLATILSTAPEILKRRGYNVDTIPKQNGQQPGEFVGKSHQNRRSSRGMENISPHVNGKPVKTNGDGTLIAVSESPTDHPVPGDSVTAADTTTTATMVDRVVNRSSDNENSPIQTFRKFVSTGRMTQRGVPTPQATPSHQVIPKSYMQSQVREAINSDRKKFAHRRNKLGKVKGFCDESGQVMKLRHCRKVEDVHAEVYVSEDLSDPEALITSKRDKLSRFVDIINPVAELFGRSLTPLHVFYENAGGPIAFNRNRSIYVNLRYFEVWHYEDAKRGDKQQAQISWFFALAHELAHNLIKEHNSEHEFWFAAICEEHIPALSRLLTQKSQ